MVYLNLLNLFLINTTLKIYTMPNITIEIDIVTKLIYLPTYFIRINKITQ